MVVKEIYFSNEKIREIARKLKADPLLVERLIFGIELLGNLVKENVDFIFKGGTSMLFVIPRIKRLSIDIDIVVSDKIYNFEKIFDRIVEKGIFKSWIEDIRSSEKDIPKKHYKFYYTSPVAKKELYVLLDILKIGTPILKTNRRILELPFIKTEEKLEVTVPTINSLAADKLTAFAPNTIGIKYKQGKSMEIIKQLFDIGVLFEYIDDLEEMREVYRGISKIEASFRRMEFKPNEFLKDSIDTAFLISQLDFKGSIENEYTKELKEGINKIKSHIIGGKYSLLNAKEDASKLACLAFLIGLDKSIALEEIRKERRNIEVIRDITFKDKYKILNKLKSISPESFYFWSIVTQSIKR